MLIFEILVDCSIIIVAIYGLIYESHESWVTLLIVAMIVFCAATLIKNLRKIYTRNKSTQQRS